MRSNVDEDPTEGVDDVPAAVTTAARGPVYLKIEILLTYWTMIRSQCDFYTVQLITFFSPFFLPLRDIHRILFSLVFPTNLIKIGINRI